LTIFTSKEQDDDDDDDDDYDDGDDNTIINKLILHLTFSKAKQIR